MSGGGRYHFEKHRHSRGNHANVLQDLLKQLSQGWRSSKFDDCTNVGTVAKKQYRSAARHVNLENRLSKPILGRKF